MSNSLTVVIASEEHTRYAEDICIAMETAAKARGTGIAKRRPEYIVKKIQEGKSVIALSSEAGQEISSFAGFCYIETWGHGKYVANSGLIVQPEYRKGGLAKRIKERIFELSRQKYPDAKIFGITTSHAVMKINTSLGYVPVPFSELTEDEEFWSGCGSCPNHDILTRTARKMCLCTGMLFDPVAESATRSAPADKQGYLPLPVLPMSNAVTHERQEAEERAFYLPEQPVAA